MAALCLHAEPVGALLDRHLLERLSRLQLVPLALADVRVAPFAENGLKILPARFVRGNDVRRGSGVGHRKTVPSPGRAAEARTLIG